MSEIRNIEFMRQVKDFSGIKFGSCRPTDIDFFMEIRNKFFIIGEFGFKNKRESYGQQLALTRLALALSESGKDVLLFFATHVMPHGRNIETAACFVRTYYSSRSSRWFSPSKQLTVLQLLLAFERALIMKEPSE